MKKSHISKEDIRDGEDVKYSDINEGIVNLIRSDHPDFSEQDHISLTELNKYRRQYLTELVREERGEQAALDNQVMEAIKNNSILSEHLHEVTEGDLTLGQRLADKVADFGGSWAFIISFFTFILLWMVVNIWLLVSKPFDP